MAKRRWLERRLQNTPTNQLVNLRGRMLASMITWPLLVFLAIVCFVFVPHGLGLFIGIEVSVFVVLVPFLFVSQRRAIDRELARRRAAG